MPKISVVMPVYNSEKYLREAIDSILNQTFRDFEFIIIDDGSSDTSPEIVRSYSDPRIRFYVNERNMGVAATLNLGLELSTGEYIARMDSDDISLPERFEKQVSFMERHPNVAICATAVRLFGAKSGDRYFSSRYAWLKVDLLFGNCFAHPTVMMRGSLKNSGELYYKTSFNQLEDYELWVRISRLYELASLSEVLLQYRIHSGQITQQYSTAYVEQETQLKRQLLEELGMEEQKYLEAFLRLKRKNLDLFQKKECVETLIKIVEENKAKRIYDQVYLKQTVSSIINSLISEFPIWQAGKTALEYGINPVNYVMMRLKAKVVRRFKAKLEKLQRNQKIKNKSITIISNNCWGSFVYQKYGLWYQSPTAGLFFLGHDFVKLCSEWERYFSLRLEFIPWEACSYYEHLKESEPYPVARLGDIEVYFMHYKTPEEAAEKWYRRIKRINPERMLFKLSQREGCSKEDIEQFMSLPLKNKLCFAYDDVPGTIHVPELKGLVGDEFPIVQGYVDDLKILNSI